LTGDLERGVRELIREICKGKDVEEMRGHIIDLKNCKGLLEKIKRERRWNNNPWKE
jgi:hypothetical protein